MAYPGRHMQRPNRLKLLLFINLPLLIQVSYRSAVQGYPNIFAPIVSCFGSFRARAEEKG